MSLLAGVKTGHKSLQETDAPFMALRLTHLHGAGLPKMAQIIQDKEKHQDLQLRAKWNRWTWEMHCRCNKQDIRTGQNIRTRLEGILKRKRQIWGNHRKKKKKQDRKHKRLSKMMKRSNSYKEIIKAGNVMKLCLLCIVIRVPLQYEDPCHFFELGSLLFHSSRNVWKC